MVGSSKPVCLSAALSLLACGSTAPDFTVHRTGVIAHSSAEFTRQPTFPARLEETVAAALDYWGGTWDKLAGVTITFEDSRYVECGGSQNAVGCYDGNIHVSTKDSGFTYYCVEETTLVHEVGHAIIGDPRHTDPRWLDFRVLERSLDGKPGYDAGDKVPCEIFVSVWRHPPDRDGDPVSSAAP